ncbi:hypothetical protein BCM14_0766 [Jezberella montanilacus]|jgi:hypothetical protein|uniref:Uncharacterized protein n=1 Tax=Jezberella montanilacus TaxID=323426 RepID=A0A2T0XK75_9BURK|nr:hypothetical protein [Jezberella montanilacus]PRY99322.1 hypothetical protein BCM14_0766 [Jezberella montanilacus]
MTVDQKSTTTGTATAQQNHLKAAECCNSAAVAHTEAAKHSASGDVKSAGYHAAVAQGHTLNAAEHSEAACKKVATAATPAPAMK